METSASSPRRPSLLECVASPAQPSPCSLESAKEQRRTWWSCLSELSSADNSSGVTSSSSAEGDGVDVVARLLREALHCVQGDEQWNCSGIAQMLQRALEMSERGCVQSARKAAVGLLDFHKMVEKYRQVVASRTKSSSSGSGKRASGEEMESDAMSEDACGPLKRQRTGSGPLDETTVVMEETGSAHFAVPHLPAKKAPAAVQQGEGVAPSASAPAAPATSVWAGTIWQNVPNGRDLTYCKISVPLPIDAAKELSESKDLEISQLVPRRAVKLGRHRVCKVSITEASSSQTAKLKSMAQNELVAVAPLENHGLIFVPYVDNHGGVRLVCFCLAL
ncbi:hypothetical protein CHLRE_06g282300v5 [Chlamydomonas reinhardtii]|uniref:Uncharacterized protein n=1 Tax=Chlamydomonas reinhardtii TaxID=3055 RepID=A0A2K3DPR1_CHLRE|nr:uncharacterized protein CHLRE_06g282300v5 [Chlamydomonas reinhardtii]PNW82523.1 hypothetical protein CHLRE_06g282300v5 [Chlamydomonas reinhardtii]